MARPKKVKRENKPKKKAFQARSKQTVSNILQACELLINEDGLEKLTTNKIAERAGVNIASLYQYFPNKEAIVTSLLTQVFEKETQLISETISKLSQHPSIPEASKSVIHLAIKLFRSSQSLLVSVMNHKGDFDYLKSAQGFTDNFVVSGKLFLNQRHKELRIKNIDNALYVLSHSVVPLLITYLSNPPLRINDQQMVDEVSELVCHYLLRNPE